MISKQTPLEKLVCLISEFIAISTYLNIWIVNYFNWFTDELVDIFIDLYVVFDLSVD